MITGFKFTAVSIFGKYGELIATKFVWLPVSSDGKVRASRHLIENMTETSSGKVINVR